MTSTEKFCLKWNDFQVNIATAYKNIRETGYFSDVTLVCEDDQQVEAHRVILSACSPFFLKVFNPFSFGPFLTINIHFSKSRNNLSSESHFFTFHFERLFIRTSFSFLIYGIDLKSTQHSRSFRTSSFEFRS